MVCQYQKGGLCRVVQNVNHCLHFSLGSRLMSPCVVIHSVRKWVNNTTTVVRWLMGTGVCQSGQSATSWVVNWVKAVSMATTNPSTTGILPSSVTIIKQVPWPIPSRSGNVSPRSGLGLAVTWSPQCLAIPLPLQWHQKCPLSVCWPLLGTLQQPPTQVSLGLGQVCPTHN